MTIAQSSLHPLTRLQLEGPIAPTVLRLALPNFGEALARIAFVTADAIFVGWLGRDALAGLGLVMPFFFLVQTATAAGLGIGASAAIARSLGAGDHDRASVLALHALLIALTVGALVAGIMLLAGPAIYRAMGGTGAALEHAIAYSTVVFAGIPLVCTTNLLANAVRGTGEMRVPAAAIVGGEALHLALSPALVLGVGPLPAMGIEGAALALLAPYLFGTVVLLAYLRGRARPARLAWSAPRSESFRAILAVGLPASLMTLLAQALILGSTALVAPFGAVALAAYTGAIRLELTLLPVVFGVGGAVVTMIGTNLGAGRPERARRVAWTGAAIGGALGALVALLCLLAPQAWMRLFSNDPDVVAIGLDYLRWVGPAAPLFGAGMALFYAAQAARRGGAVLAASALRLLIAVGGGWLAVRWYGAGLDGLFACAAIAAAAGGVWMIAATARMTWR